MKKYLLLFFVFSLAAAMYLSFPISSKEHFVSIKDKAFELEGKPFYPIALNYVVTMQANDNGDLWPSSFNGYNAGEKYRYTGKDSSLMELKAELDLIKEMGFNTVRIVRIGEEQVDEATGLLSVSAIVKNERTVRFQLEQKENFIKYTNALDTLFDLADQAGLKVIFLVNVQPDVATTDMHLMKIAQRFKESSSIMAFDFFNEPLYFDKKDRHKKEVIEITSRWRQIVRMYAPKHLTTIGLEGIREVFEWDPNILDVDFISLHPYQYEPEQVRNEIYWYGKYITKPWMLGETAISADNDSVSYEEQRKFAEVTLKQTRNCGGIGYSWWQYKDVDWHLFHANYMGVVNWTGFTKTKKPNIPVGGTVKPLVEEFKKFDPSTPKEECLCFKNYYNYTSNNSFRIIGKFVDEESGKPIEGAVILGWNEGWTHSYHTISKADGTFELTSNYPFYHWMASSTNYLMIRGEVMPDTAKTVNGIRTLDFGQLTLQELK